MPRESRHRVSYDADGNIVIGAEIAPASLHARVEAEEIEPDASEELIIQENTTTWNASESADMDDPWMKPIDETTLQINPKEKVRRDQAAYARAIQEHLATVSTMTRSALGEGIHQYKMSLAGGMPMLGTLEQETKSWLRTIWDFLWQPVWIPGKKNNVKEYSRGVLFALDIIRFGGTFALIFGVLFVALNYQSFFEIARSTVDRVLAGPSLDTPGAQVDSALMDSLKANGGGAGRLNGSLLSYLPSVGPPENRIIVPKLNLNVPLVTPPTDALLRQDWTQVENDIQAALQKGVVHYPGTAKPGQAGNFFVTGHSSYYPWAPGDYKTVFARLSELSIGDEYWVYYGGDKHRYIIRAKKEVSPTDTTVLDQPADQRISTLMTCTPVGTSLRRLIVQAEEVDPDTGVALKIGEHAGDQVVPKVNLDALPI